MGPPTAGSAAPPGSRWHSTAPGPVPPGLAQRWRGTDRRTKFPFFLKSRQSATDPITMRDVMSVAQPSDLNPVSPETSQPVPLLQSAAGNGSGALVGRGARVDPHPASGRVELLPRPARQREPGQAFRGHGGRAGTGHPEGLPRGGCQTDAHEGRQGSRPHAPADHGGLHARGTLVLAAQHLPHHGVAGGPGAGPRAHGRGGGDLLSAPAHRDRRPARHPHGGSRAVPGLDRGAGPLLRPHAGRRHGGVGPPGQPGHEGAGRVPHPAHREDSR